MGNKYTITGVQIGMILAFLDFGKYQEIKDILQKILDGEVKIKC